ncbi:MAG: hypothetical protein OXH84_01620 [Gammaproteobacteria bacterium]|nr:hypothetical protein [Gammaproteobacteria bacterium]
MREQLDDFRRQRYYLTLQYEKQLRLDCQAEEDRIAKLPLSERLVEVHEHA